MFKTVNLLFIKKTKTQYSCVAPVGGHNGPPGWIGKLICLRHGDNNGILPGTQNRKFNRKCHRYNYPAEGQQYSEISGWIEKLSDTAGIYLGQDG